MKRVVKERTDTVNVSELSDADIIGGIFKDGCKFQLAKFSNCKYINIPIGVNNDFIETIVYNSIREACNDGSFVDKVFTFEGRSEFIKWLAE